MDIAQKIREMGIKATTQRVVVYSTLMELGHTSAEEVATIVRASHPSITIATVYSILDSFCTSGLISRLSTPSGKIHYDVTPYPHHHIYHKDGTVTDYNDPELSAILENYFRGKDIGNEIESLKLQLFVN